MAQNIEQFSLGSPVIGEACGFLIYVDESRFEPSDYQLFFTENVTEVDQRSTRVGILPIQNSRRMWVLCSGLEENVFWFEVAMDEKPFLKDLVESRCFPLAKFPDLPR